MSLDSTCIKMKLKILLVMLGKPRIERASFVNGKKARSKKKKNICENQTGTIVTY